ncbi:F box protein, for ubiquitin dependent degradation [Suhomyces tanzawaensis NRRL Y-17324]|uniref:F box protein, for ubiquitin dependent degradation n=1 Tax=Suhomyces tanzawaensis NRRL Y-17324 TaxID=984487 RepID=A0A1E4SRS5_9ASCO|nr:F box protein, for ubiquitin dependent degradation [Suhomyces tanzawaensis NRRL Y-17324]ODV82219.1 F box protein, for ubiquitin dependent degradation [Suhomyces tanzawaensis NRRL Y-17324]
MTRGKLPLVFPLQESVPKFEFENENLQGKLCDVWLQNEYQKLSIRNEPRENRKRYRTGTNMANDGTSYDKESTESGDDMLISDTDCNSQSSVVLSFYRERDGLVHPPKRRLTTNEEGSVSTIGLNNCNKAGCPSAGACGGNCADNNGANIILVATAPITVNANINSNNPRTPNSPSPSTPDFEPQQLPLPSPSASPVSGDNTKPPYNPIESQLIPPSTQGELIDMMLNLSNYLSDRNQNHLIFKLLQNVNRSSLSSLNGIIDHSLRRDLISNLPLELTYKILSYLDYKTLLSISRVCKSWSKIINNTNIWVNLLKKDKLITDDKVIQQELTNPDQNLNEWSSDSTKFNLAQILYKKRCIIYNRWMKPSYIPKRISVKCPSSKVVTCLQHDDEKIITGIDDKPINIYSSKTGKLLKVLEGHEGGVWALKYTGNTLVTGSTDRTIRLWNIATGKCTHIFRGHTSTIRCLDIIHPTVIGKDENGVDITFPEFPLLITGSRDHNIHVWKLPLSDGEEANDDDAPFDCNEVDNPYLIAILSGHTQAVRTITGYGNIIISGSYDSTVRVWDLLNNGTCKHVLSEHSDKVYSIAMDFESKLCYSASMDHTINVWNFEHGKLVNTLEGHTSLVGLVELVDGVLVSGAADTSLRIWDPKSGENYFKLEGHSNSITCFKHDGLRIVSGSERMLKLWDTKKGKFTRDLLNDVSGNIWQVSINYKRCIAAIQRFNSQGEDEAYIEILDFSESPKAIETPQEFEME